MKKLFGILNGVFIFASMAQAQPATAPAATQTNATSSPTSAPAPARPNTAIIPNLTGNFMKAHTNNVAVAEKGDIDVLFIMSFLILRSLLRSNISNSGFPEMPRSLLRGGFTGDSITDWWRNPGRGAMINGALPYGGKDVFDKHFGSMKVANFGIAGDTTQGVLWRLQHGEGQGYKPKAIMLMIGTNNSGRNSPPEIAIGVADIVFELRKDFPDAKILLLGIFPRGGVNERFRGPITQINQIISALNDQQHVFYMDIGYKFLADDGSIPKEIMSDGLHPTSKGYEIWANAVHDTLVGFLQ